MRILQLYVTRELLKTFALAAFGLTLVLSLCGVMANLAKAESVEVLTAVDVLQILWLVQPMVLTVTFPVSALFACAIVYGRLAADNEFDACKASGVNIHRLLAPAFILSLFTAGFAFLFSNYVIPESAERIAAMIRQDLPRIAFQALKNKGAFKVDAKSRGYLSSDGKKSGRVQVLHADKASLGTDDDRKVLALWDAVFLDLRNDEVVLCGTAKQVRTDFVNNPAKGEPVVQAVLTGIRGIDFSSPEPRLNQGGENTLSVTELPSMLPYNPTWLTLADLLRYLHDPVELPPIRVFLSSLREEVRDQVFYRRLHDVLDGQGKVLRFEEGKRRCEIAAGGSQVVDRDFQTQKDSYLKLEKVTVTDRWVDEKGKDRRREYRADLAQLKLGRNPANTREVVWIRLQDKVLFTDSIEPSKQVPRSSINLEPVSASPELLDGDKSYTDEQLLGLDAVAGKKIRSREQLAALLPPLGFGPQVELLRMKALAKLILLKHELAGTLHARMGLSLSALVTLVLASALGIILRNGQFLTAFVISFLPGLVVVGMNIAGRKLSESPHEYLHLSGVGVIWVGVVLLVLVDIIVLMKYLRR